jgi:hypothetical protein
LSPRGGYEKTEMKKVKHEIWVNLIYILFSLSLTYLFFLYFFSAVFSMTD